MNERSPTWDASARCRLLSGEAWTPGVQESPARTWKSMPLDDEKWEQGQPQRRWERRHTIDVSQGHKDNTSPRCHIREEDPSHGGIKGLKWSSWCKLFCPKRKSRDHTQRSTSRSRGSSSESSERSSHVPRPLEQTSTTIHDSFFVRESLNWHNYFRVRHQAPPLVVSPQLCASAQEWANLLAHTNSFRYRNQKDVGENQYCRPLLHPLGDLTGKEVSVYWYSSIRKYDFSKKPDLLHIQAGPFSQLVWAGTKYLGIAKAKTKRSQKVFVVAHYYPPGNATGRFHENVFPLASHQRGKFYDDEGNNLSEAVQPAEAKEEKGKGKGKGDLAYNRWLGKRDTSISSQESSHSS